VAVDRGGGALVRVVGLRDIEPLRSALDWVPDAVVGLAVSDHFYRSVVWEGDPGLMPGAYRRVLAAPGTAWIRLIEYDVPEGNQLLHS
jgi:hypothetical protein